MPGIWHNDWENNFPKEASEITYISRRGQQELSHRRCDARINKKIILEFQHSKISKKDVDERKEDWEDHGKDILWIIDGIDDNTIVKRDDDIYIIEPKQTWKYLSFKSYEYIFYETLNKVFLLDPNDFKSNQIYGQYYMEKEDAIIYFQNIQNTKITKETIYNQWKMNKEEIKPKIIKVQKGAGNGKTFTIFKEMCENVNKDLFILVTKQNSAVDTLYKEFTDQKERQEIHIFNLLDVKEYQSYDEKKWIIKYQHKITKRNVTVIIGTIDSFAWSFRKDHNMNCRDPWAQSIIDLYEKGPDKIGKKGQFRYAGDPSLKLNKKTQIWIDEAQDLDIPYFNPFVKLMDIHSFDMGMVGDKIQSLQGVHNLFTKKLVDLDGFDGIKIEETKPVNINRRIKVKNLASAINKYVNFEEYELPEISINEDELEDRGKSENVFKVICLGGAGVFHKDEKKSDRMEFWVQDIIGNVKKEIYMYNYLPQDFVFIFPILSGRTEIQELLSSLQELWIEIFEDKKYREKCVDEYWLKNNHINSGEYTEYVKFHKSEKGENIKLHKSIHKSRIVSILTSKGMGRKVVFALNVTEQALKQCSNHNITLQYESYFHVSITRAEYKQYFYLIANGDDIHKRFYNNEDALPYMPKISKYINIKKLKDYIDTDKIISLLDNVNNINTDEEKNTDSVEWGHHCIRYTVYFMILIYKVLKYEKKSEDYNDHKKQIETVFSIVKNALIVPMNVKKYWKNLKSYSGLNNYTNDVEIIPIMEIHKHEVYHNHMKEILKVLLFVQNNIHNLDSHPKLKSFHLVCLCHLISIARDHNKARPNINELYQLMDLFKNDKNEGDKRHYHKLLKINNILDKTIEQINKEYSNVQWNLLHKLTYMDGKSRDLVLMLKGIPLIGFNKDFIIHLVLKTRFGSAEKYNVITDILLERFMILHPDYQSKSKHDEKPRIDNYKRYHKKKLITYLFILETGTVRIFDDDELSIYSKIPEFKEEIKKGILKYYTQQHKELYYYVYKHIKSWKKLKKEADKENDNDNDDQIDKKINIKCCDTPYQFIKTEIKTKMPNVYPDYIIVFFDLLHSSWIEACDTKNKEAKSKIKKIYETEDNFVKRLNKLVDIELDKFLNIKKDIDDDF